MVVDIVKFFDIVSRLFLLFILIMLLLLVLFILFVGNYIYPYKKKGELPPRGKVGRYFRNLPTNPLLYSFFHFEVFL